MCLLLTTCLFRSILHFLRSSQAFRPGSVLPPSKACGRRLNCSTTGSLATNGLFTKFLKKNAPLNPQPVDREDHLDAVNATGAFAAASVGRLPDAGALAAAPDERLPDPGAVAP